MIVAWKWAQNTANNCEYCLSLSTSNKPKLAQAPKKNKKTKPISQNIGKHQKKKKNPSIYSGFRTPIGWKSLFFFVFFGACQCFVRLCFVFFAFFGACQCLERSKPPNIDKKKTNTRCTKLWQALKNKIQHLLRILDPHRLEIFVFFCFFWCLPMFCEIVLCFFLLFLVPANVLRDQATKHWQEKKQTLDAQNSDRH